MWGATCSPDCPVSLVVSRSLMPLREAFRALIPHKTWWEETLDLFLFFWHTYKTNTRTIKNNIALLWYVSLPCVQLKNMPQFTVLCLLRYNITALQWATSEDAAGKLDPIVLKRATPSNPVLEQSILLLQHSLVLELLLFFFFFFFFASLFLILLFSGVMLVPPLNSCSDIIDNPSSFEGH